MAEQKSFTATIKTIYFYFFAGVGLILLITGVFQLSQWAVKSFVLPKYDLNYEESRCDFMPVKIEGEAARTAEQTKEDCVKKLEEQRNVRQVTDFAQSATFIVVGGIVFVFHFRRTSLLQK